LAKATAPAENERAIQIDESLPNRWNLNWCRISQLVNLSIGATHNLSIGATHESLNHPDAIAGVDLTRGQVRETKTVTAETKTADDSKRSPPRLTGPRFSYRVIHGKQ